MSTYMQNGCERNLTNCLDTYGFDPNYYFTAPGMSFDCMLKYTEVELELLSDYDKIMMIEQ
ncbi:Integrase catalytic domain-containing protein, partial [Aphis craccivora]